MNIPHTQLAFDIVVLGGGAAGALAAIQAKQLGASVAFVTKESALVGGATIMAGGGTCTTMSSEDSGETYYNDILKSGQWINDRRLVHLVADNATQALYNLENCNFLLDRNDLKFNGPSSMRTFHQGEGHSYPRAYLDRREALGFCHGLSKMIMRHEIPRFTETIAVKLLKDDTGKICGVVCYNLIDGTYLIFKCKAVVLATGGLGALYEETTNSNVLSGTGYALAYEAGTELQDMEMVQFMPLTLPYPRLRRGKIIGMCSLMGPDVKLLNGKGERYMRKYDPEHGEFATRDIAARANYMEIKAGRGTKNNAIIVDNRDFVPASLKRWQDANPFRWRQCCQTYGMKAGNWEEPFEAIPSQHFFMGGVRIDGDLQTRVPGLFAVGEVSGGVHGANRLSGVAFAEVFTLGPICGKSAYEYAKKMQDVSWNEEAALQAVEELERPLSFHGEGVRPYQIKQKLQKIVSGKLGPVRNGAELDEAIAALESLRWDTLPQMTVFDGDRRYNRERLDALEIPLMIETAMMIARSAACRTESRGSHYREDYPEKDPAWVKNVVIRKDGNGTMAVDVVAVREEE